MLEKEPKNPFPQMIMKLPEADVPFPGVRGWVSQGPDHQIVFFDIEATGSVGEHSHKAQWGTVIEGEMVLTVNGAATTYKRGDSYYIPDDAPHSAVFRSKTRAFDFFASKDRYRIKD